MTGLPGSIQCSPCMQPRAGLESCPCTMGVRPGKSLKGSMPDSTQTPQCQDSSSTGWLARFGWLAVLIVLRCVEITCLWDRPLTASRQDRTTAGAGTRSAAARRR